MRALILLAVVPALSLAGWLSPDVSAAIAARARSPLAFAQYAIVHGEVEPRPVIEATFRFQNSSNQQTRITKLTPSCGCLRPTLTGGEEDGTTTLFEPGEAGAFTISVETAQEPAGPHEYSVVVESESDGVTTKQTVRYVVTLPAKKLTVQPNALLFFQLQSEAGEQTLQVFDPRPTPAQITDITCDEPLVSATVGPRSADGTTPIVVRVAEGLPPGQKRTWLRIETSDPEYPRIQIPIVLRGPAS